MPHLTTRSFDLTRLLPGPRYCAGCAERVCRRLAQMPGIIETRCDPEDGSLTVTHDPASLASGPLEELVERLALDEAGAAGHAVYRLEGLD
jgi:copper chaperone CopZ